MYRVAEFQKVSFEQYKKDLMNVSPDVFADMSEEQIHEAITEIYNGIQIPKRATAGSAGYDFFTPVGFSLPVGSSTVIPTGIRCVIVDGWCLKAYPRSGHGFKYGISLANTVGVIDSDYAASDNEGHIMVKLVNNAPFAKEFSVQKDGAFCQMILTPYGITYDDNAEEIRNGGFGSTGA